MKILFISSGNSKSGISPIIKNQADSLVKNAIEIDFFLIKGKGLIGYLKNIFKLRQEIRKQTYDIYHAHYSLSAFVASLAGAKPLVVSLMGSDVKAKSWYKLIIKTFNLFFWKVVMVKSLDMKKSIQISNAKVVPNGVDLTKFKPINKIESIKQLGWDETKKHLLFAANPSRYEKNFKLVEESFRKLNFNMEVELHVFQDISNHMIPLYMNASDVILLSSFWEGSPNVIKEAMACNKPIVATGVGDIPWLLQNVKGCFISDFSIHQYSESIEKALEYSSNHLETNGRDKLNSLSLDAANVANQIIQIYNSIINAN